jgi:hypothetical protein
MKATKRWGPCSCGCGQEINAGDEFAIVEGSFYMKGHEERRTRQIKAIKPDHTS